MILYNWLAAEFCMENQIPILFRTQADPSEDCLWMKRGTSTMCSSNGEN